MGHGDKVCVVVFNEEKWRHLVLSSCSFAVSTYSLSPFPYRASWLNFDELSHLLSAFVAALWSDDWDSVQRDLNANLTVRKEEKNEPEAENELVQATNDDVTSLFRILLRRIASRSRSFPQQICRSCEGIACQQCWTTLSLAQISSRSNQSSITLVRLFFCFLLVHYFSFHCTFLLFFHVLFFCCLLFPSLPLSLLFSLLFFFYLLFSSSFIFSFSFFSVVLISSLFSSLLFSFLLFSSLLFSSLSILSLLFLSYANICPS
jgi:hypothetical protein